MHLGAVEADGLDAEANLAGCGLGQREFVELQNFGAAEGVEANNLCGCWVEMVGLLMASEIR